MNRVLHNRLGISCIAYVLLYIICLPWYRYVFDVDGIGYIGVAKQWINGNMQHAINGYWPPLHSWIIIPLMKAGILPEDAFRYTNAAFSLLTIIGIQRLLNRFELTEGIKTLLQFTAVPILLHYTFFELAADLLLVCILILLFNLLLHPLIRQSIALNMVAGMLGALAFFAKSYAFPYFIFSFIVFHLLLNETGRKKWLMIASGLLTFLLLTFPWLWALHWKYDMWMIAHGKFNSHWRFGEVPVNIPLIAPPPYEGSPGYWEDPWHVRFENIKGVPLFTVAMHLGRVILFNMQQWLISLHELSFLATGILIGTVIKYFQTKQRVWLFLLIIMITLPSGYWLLHIETRFLWTETFILIIAGALLLNEIIVKVNLRKWQTTAIWVIFIASFLLYPLDHLKDNLNRNKSLYATADKLKAAGM